jgi:hypothetical protein
VLFDGHSAARAALTVQTLDALETELEEVLRVLESDEPRPAPKSGKSAGRKS